MLTISLILNLILFSSFILYHKKRKFIKDKATIAFLKTKLKSATQQRGVKRYRVTLHDKFIIAMLYKFLGCPEKLCFTFKPDTILKWYRNRVKRFWTFSSNRGKPGRPGVDKETIALIIRLKRENPTWGARRIRGELKS